MVPSVRWYTQLKNQMVSLSPDHQQNLRERKNLQHTYSVEMEKTRIADLINELRADPERMADLVRFTNLQNYHSSAWMDLSPTSKYNTFTNLELQSALAFYIGETTPLLPGKCNCKSKDHIDPFGNHTIICKTGGGPTRRHDSIKFVMHGMLNKAGIRCSVEDKHQFRSLYPSDNTRADLTARGFGNMGQDLLMDFCCGHPGAKCYSKKKNIARSPGLIFPGMEKRKNKMYLAKAISLNITFMPMSVTFLSVISKAAEMIS
jgi:hypothetical protein